MTPPKMSDELAVALSAAIEQFDNRRFHGMAYLHDAHTTKTIQELCGWLETASNLIGELRSIVICSQDLLDMKALRNKKLRSKGADSKKDFAQNKPIKNPHVSALIHELARRRAEVENQIISENKIAQTYCKDHQDCDILWMNLLRMARSHRDKLPTIA